jgi:hypothetical protein
MHQHLVRFLTGSIERVLFIGLVINRKATVLQVEGAEDMRLDLG